VEMCPCLAPTSSGPRFEDGSRPSRGARPLALCNQLFWSPTKFRGRCKKELNRGERADQTKWNGPLAFSRSCLRCTHARGCGRTVAPAEVLAIFGRHPGEHSRRAQRLAASGLARFDPCSPPRRRAHGVPSATRLLPGRTLRPLLLKMNLEPPRESLRRVPVGANTGKITIAPRSILRGFAHGARIPGHRAHSPGVFGPLRRSREKNPALGPGHRQGRAGVVARQAIYSAVLHPDP
jgi:hypothetical protein